MQKINSIACNLDTRLDAAIVNYLINGGIEFELITASAEVVKYLKHQNIAAINARDYRSLARYTINNTVDPSYKYKSYFSIFDRYIISGNISLEMRSMYFDAAWKYWSEYIENNQIGFVLFKKTPCLLYDLVLYLLCKELHIKKTIIEKTYWRQFLILQSSFEEHQFVCNQKPPLFVEDVSERIRQNRRPYWTETKLKKEGWEESLTGRKRYSAVAKNVLTRLVGEPTRVREGFYDDIFVPSDQVTKFNRIQTIIYARKIRSSQKKILNEYADCLSKWDDSLINRKTLIYFLQCEPEKNACPLGGKYSNQLFAIQELANWLPEDYAILVKDHPSQFRRWHSLERGRGEDFYKKIVDMGCLLVDHKISNRDLFESSSLNISITGTVVFEAWILGYKVAYMGHPWYSMLDIPKVTCKEELLTLLQSSPSVTTYEQKVSPIKDYVFSGYDTSSNEKMYANEDNILESSRSLGKVVLDCLVDESSIESAKNRRSIL